MDHSILTFFSSPNIVWPAMEAGHPAAERIMPFLRALDTQGECPLVLPRRDRAGEPSTVYVVCWDHSHAGRMRPLLQAAVADYLSPFDGRVALLSTDDPVEAAIHSLVGTGTTFVLKPSVQTEGRLVVALQRLVRSLDGRPRRTLVLPRPVGRMLREFDLALAAGAADQSAAILQEIKRAGGISHENVAFLEIQRLGRLGRDRELLAHGSLPTIVLTEPPIVVSEAILAAWGRTNLYVDGILDLDGAANRIGNQPIDIAMLVVERIATSSDPDALTVGALVSMLRDDALLREAFRNNADLPDEVRVRLAAHLPTVTVADEVGAEPNTRSVAALGLRPGTADATNGVAPVHSWLEWVNLVDEADSAPPVEDLVSSWAPAWQVDAELGPAIDKLSELPIDALLAGVAAFLNTADPGHPAPQTARAFTLRYLIAERFGPADLSALAALVAIFISSAPDAHHYAELLRDIGDFAPQWSSVSTAAQALDLADVVVCGPRPSPDAQVQFVSTVLGPLNAQRQRLAAELRSLASMITRDAGLEWDWTVPEAGGERDLGDLPEGTTLLLYSLDAGTLTRVAASLIGKYPSLTIHQSSDKVGNPALRQHSRNADLVVIATGRATHAATNFIVSHARGKVCYPDGFGAASMLRVIAANLEDLRSADWVSPLP